MRDKFDLITSDFTYVRWLRKGIEEKTTTWVKVIVDREGDLSEWVSLPKKVQERGTVLGRSICSAGSGAWKHRAWFFLRSERGSNLRYLISVDCCGPDATWFIRELGSRGIGEMQSWAARHLRP